VADLLGLGLAVTHVVGHAAEHGACVVFAVAGGYYLGGSVQRVDAAAHIGFLAVKTRLVLLRHHDNCAHLTQSAHGCVVHDVVLLALTHAVGLERQRLRVVALAFAVALDCALDAFVQHLVWTPADRLGSAAAPTQAFVSFHHTLFHLAILTARTYVFLLVVFFSCCVTPNLACGQVD